MKADRLRTTRHGPVGLGSCDTWAFALALAPAPAVSEGQPSGRRGPRPLMRPAATRPHAVLPCRMHTTLDALACRDMSPNWEGASYYLSTLSG